MQQDENTDEEASSANNRLLIIFGVPIFLVSLYLLFVIAINKLSFHILTLEELGSLGDSFGLLTSLFTGIALMAALHLISQQKSEMKKIQKHGKMMSKIERASFQPQLKIQGSFISGSAEQNRTLKINFEDSQHRRFYIFQEIKLSDKNVKHEVVERGLEKQVILETPISKNCTLYFKYKDLSGYVTIITFLIVAEPREGHHHKPSEGKYCIDYNKSHIVDIDFTENEE